MPTYNYFCKIHKEFEVQQSIKDEPLNECPKCVEEKNKEYYCKSCDTSWTPNNELEHFIMESDVYCKNCNKPDIIYRTPKPKKLVSLSSFMLKGGGWASSGYNK